MSQPLRWLNEADRARRSGRYEKALRYYSRALELDRTQIRAWLGQVQMLIFLGEYPEAEVWCRKTLQLFPRNGDLQAAGAQALCRERMFSRAWELCDASLAGEGSSAYRWMVRGELLLATRRQVADLCLQKACTLDSDWLVAVEAALVFRHYGQPAKAIPYLRSALEKAATEGFPWYLLGLCQSDLGFSDAARRSFEQCLSIDRHDDRAKGGIAELVRRGRSLFRRFRNRT